MAEPASNHVDAAIPPPAPATASDTSKPAVLIIGGLGYIGRYLALHIHKNNLASEVRLVDKVLPQLAWLAPEFAEACSQDKFMQADATREQSLPKIFIPLHAAQYSYVFNCGGETRYSQDDSVYTARSTALSLTLARECARRRTPALIEFSTGMVYKSPSSSTISGGGCTETAPLKPWLKLAKHKLAAEEGLEKTRKEVEAEMTKKGLKNGDEGFQELRYAVLRLAHVWGEYDVGFLARGLCLAKVFQKKGEEMKWLYGSSLRINTIHVHDVCTAAWATAVFLASTPSSSPILSDPSPSAGRIFNIVDRGDTSQGTLAAIIHEIFNIPTGFQNSLISTFAKFNLESVVDDVNEDVLQPWADLLSEKGVKRAGPIGPFMEKELLKDCDLCLNAGRAEKVLGWRPGKETERMGVEGVRGAVASYERMGWWP
ncbi:hypothetical protein MMC30_000169 [Trapelia coarctata]|nr:hypothetical protein [Trapelia coarctata]